MKFTVNTGISLALPAYVLLMLYTPSVMAAGDVTKTPEIFSLSYAAQVIGALLLVFSCFYGIFFLLKKVNALPGSDNLAIRILGATRVGTREKIVLIEADGVRILVGVSVGSVRTLHTFSNSESPISNETAAPSSFSNILKQSSL